MVLVMSCMVENTVGVSELAGEAGWGGGGAVQI